MLEDGHRANPSAALLARIAAIYGRSLDELFTDDDEPAGVA
jgi:transcriptional regulator with XRE-family HTH domain